MAEAVTTSNVIPADREAREPGPNAEMQGPSRRVIADARPNLRADDPSRLATTTLAVEGMHCGGCMRKVEQALTAVAGVVSARANLSARRVTTVTG